MKLGDGFLFYAVYNPDARTGSGAGEQVMKQGTQASAGDKL